MSSSQVEPEGLKNAGKRLWAAVIADFDLSEGELQILGHAATVADVIDELSVIVGKDGPLIDVDGVPRTHPALVERRQQQLLFGRLLVALRIPQGDDEEPVAGPRTQRRGMRGFYGARDGAA